MLSSQQWLRNKSRGLHFEQPSPLSWVFSSMRCKKPTNQPTTPSVLPSDATSDYVIPCLTKCFEASICTTPASGSKKWNRGEWTILLTVTVTVTVCYPSWIIHPWLPLKTDLNLGADPSSSFFCGAPLEKWKDRRCFCERQRIKYKDSKSFQPWQQPCQLMLASQGRKMIYYELLQNILCMVEAWKGLWYVSERASNP